MDDWDAVAAFALSLPDTVAEPYYGGPAIKVASTRRAFVTAAREAGSFHLAIDLDTKEVLLETDPDSYWQTPHYEGWAGVLVRYASADPERVQESVTPVHFTRFAAIDWSGAKGVRHPGIALAACEAGDDAPVLIDPPHKAWSRTEILRWLGAHADEALLVGFDFSFAPPFEARGAYLPGEDTPVTARAFWGYVDMHAPDADLGAASFLEARRGTHFYLGAADGTKADFLHFRVCEAHNNAQGFGKPSTVYDAIGASQVAKASFAGMRLLHHLGTAVPVWPFDPIPTKGACIVEIYTTIAARAAGLRKGISKLRDGAALDAALAAFGCAPHTPLAHYSDHATDAILTAAWLRANATRPELWHPPALTAEIARTEGWTFGIA